MHHLREGRAKKIPYLDIIREQDGSASAPFGLSSGHLLSCRIIKAVRVLLLECDAVLLSWNTDLGVNDMELR